MSLENSQYTYFSIQGASAADIRKEVDRITKEADHVETSDDETTPAATAAVPAKRGRYSESQQSPPSSQSRREPRIVSGVVLEILLENFLCHSHYQVVLNQEINFIVGRNGSGKSAILTALVVALGGHASNTGRGAALKDFVKKGCLSGKVTCVVSNAGALNFRKEEFGDKITVVRTISAQGGSNIKLKSCKGKLISSKMEDLRAMTLQLGIQVDNPISVLDQNTARHFLNQSKPTNKFDLFMKATNLESLQNTFVEIALVVDKINQEIKKKERQLVDNNSEVLEIQRKYEMLQSLEEDRKKGDKLRMELLWAGVRDSLIALERLQGNLKKFQKDKEHLDNLLSSEEQSEPLLQEIESAKIASRALEDQDKQIDNELKDLRTKFTSISQNNKKCLQDKQQVERQIRSDEKMIKEYKTEIQTQEKKLLPEHVDERRRQRDQIHELQRLLEQYKGERDSKDAEAKKLHVAAIQKKDHVEQLNKTKRKHDDEIRTCHSKLQGLQNTQSNLSLFGQFIPELVRQIECSNRFRKKPVGPLGAYVKVKDAKWAAAVESLIKGRLTAFVVDNVEDERLLHSMFKNIFTRGPQPGIIRTPFPTTLYNTTRTAARTSNYCNVLDVVEISNVVAHNILIELCHLETTMLIPTDKECHELLAYVEKVPRNCEKALTLKADQYFPAPNYKTYSATGRHSVSVLQASRDGVIRELRERIHGEESKVNEVVNDLSFAQNELEKTQRLLVETRSNMNKLGKMVMDTQAKLEELKDVQHADTHSISGLREELAELERKQHENESKLKGFPDKLKTFELEFSELKQKQAQLKEKQAKIKEEIETYGEKQKNCRDQLDEIRSVKVDKKRKLDQVIKQAERCTTECQNLEEKHNEEREKAVKYEMHIQAEAEAKGVEFQSYSNTERNIKIIDQEYRALLKRLSSIEKTIGQNAETTEKEYHEKLTVYNHTKNVIISHKTNAAHLIGALEARRSLYHTQKNLMSAVVSHQFTRVLRFRNCVGHVKVNFKDKSLDINVGPVDEGERAGLGTSSLSGGERSYATMAFVIALWNVTELPFYYLDEFDVFMDVLNRQTVLTLLLRFAKQKSGYQFGFLTPLDTTDIIASKRVSIFKLSDPRPD